MMSLVAPSLLREHGFDQHADVRFEFVERPPEDVGEAAGWQAVAAMSLATLMQPAIASLHFEPARSLAMEQQGVSLEAAREVPGVYRVVSRSGTNLHVLQGSAHVRSQHDPRAIIWDGRESPVLVVRINDALIAFGAERAGVRVELRMRSPDAALRVAPFTNIEGLLHDWARQSSDPWGSGELKRLVGERTHWAHLTAAALDARLHEPSAQGARQRVQQLLSGKVDEPLVRARRWAQSLPSPQLEAVETLAVEKVSLLHGALRAVIDAEEMTPAIERTWLSACHLRDDLAGVLLLLGEAGAGDRLHAALEPIDRLGLEARLNMPAGPAAADERLRRVASRQPSAWWAGPPSEDAG